MFFVLSWLCFRSFVVMFSFAFRGYGLASPEIHARMIEALRPFELAEIEPLKAIAQQGLETFSPAMFEAITKHPPCWRRGTQASVTLKRLEFGRHYTTITPVLKLIA